MFRNLYEQYHRYKQYRETYNALNNLSDYELKDIGLSRGMIKRTAIERADYLDANDNLKGWV
jgi:uncharacterized protein YjiS (DUF1127 family)